jgi:type IV secretory pathway TrbD component
MPDQQPNSTSAAIRRQVQNRESLRLTMLFALLAILAVLSSVRRVLGDETLQGGALGARIALLMAGCIAAVVHAGIAVWVFVRVGAKPVVLPTILSSTVKIVLSAIAGSSAATDLLSLARAVREDPAR